MAPRPRVAATLVATCLGLCSLATIGASVAVADDGSSTTIPTDTTAPATTVTTTTVARKPTVPAATKPRRVRIGSVRVVLDEQKVYVYAKTGRLITTMPVSTGLWDSTPTGSFKVFSKSARTFYTPNPKEKMRWMTRFTKGRNGGNIGFHGIPYTVTKAGEKPFPTPLGRAPSSHGCVRMKVSDAKWIFDNLDIGAKVVVVRTRR